jgi:hypothetical protein
MVEAVDTFLTETVQHDVNICAKLAIILLLQQVVLLIHCHVFYIFHEYSHLFTIFMSTRSFQVHQTIVFIVSYWSILAFSLVGF